MWHPMTLIRLCFVLFTWGLEIKITTDTDHVLVFVFQFCFVLFCFFFVIRTSIFRVKPGLILLSGQFQPGNVLSYALIFQWRNSDNFLKLHTDLMTGMMYYWRHTKGMCRKNKILHALWFLVGYYVIQIFWI